MPPKVENALGLTYTKTFGNCFSVKNKQVPFIGHIKDVQFAFAFFLDKKIKMPVLAVDVPAFYRMLVGYNFCKDVELNMDMSEARIPIKGDMQEFLLERETRYTVVKSNDPYAKNSI